MPFFSKVFKGNQHTPHVEQHQRRKDELSSPETRLPQENVPADAWNRTSVLAEEVQELLHVCTQELKSRALDTPFLLLPFRPDNNPNLGQSYIRDFFTRGHGAQEVRRLQQQYRDLHLVEPMVLCSIAKWCWSRLPGGVVTWKTYELFRSGELESNMTRNSFDTFIPLSVESEARRQIVFDFFDLLSAIAAHAKTNGLGGRKLSRLAGWWAFEHSDEGKGFDGGYRSWATAANATSHLFFAYLRSRAPDPSTDTTGISHIPRFLQSLVVQTDYPPETPPSLQTWTSKVVMIVDSVSPSPHALLRRANQFDYRHEDTNLQQFGRHDEPLDTLTTECRRVMNCICATSMTASTSSPKQSSWSRFEDSGFSSIVTDSGHAEGNKSTPSRAVSDSSLLNVRTAGQRPATPSWADFMSSGFSTNSLDRRPASLLVSPSVMLPPINTSTPPTSPPRDRHDSPLDDGRYAELASISHLHLDETFWWVWMTSLAGEEPLARKAVFGRCAFVETKITGGRWLVLEEQVKGATEEAESPDIRVVPKKSRFGFGKIGRTRRRSSTKQTTEANQSPESLAKVRSNTVGSDEQAKVQAVAAAIVQKQQEEERIKIAKRRGRMDDNAQRKTMSVLTIQPNALLDVAPALQWARNFDKKESREKYLGDLASMRGIGSPISPNKALPIAPLQMAKRQERDLPAPPQPMKPISKAPIGQQPMTPPSSPPTTVSFSDAAKPNTRSPDSHVFQDYSNNASRLETPSRPQRKPVSYQANLMQRLGIPQPLSSNPIPDSNPHGTTIEAPQVVVVQPTIDALYPGNGPTAMLRPRMFQKSSTGSVRGLVNIFNKRKTGMTSALTGSRPMASSARASQLHVPVAEEMTLPLEEVGIAASLKANSSTVLSGMQSSVDSATRREELEPRTYEPSHFYQSLPHSPASLELHDANFYFRDFSSDSGEANGPTTPEPLRSQPHIASFKTRAAALLAPASLPDLNPSQAAHANISGYITPADSPEPQTTSGSGSHGDDSYEDDGASTRSVHVATQPTLPIVVSQSSFSHDRWAQIRKHATERRMSEDKSQSVFLSTRPSMSVAGYTERTDDTDASGAEEPIEARVARIKARVAALTNNGQPVSAALVTATPTRWTD